MDVAAWLRGLGLDQYEAAFRDNGADASVLPELTSDDLREMGVAAVGHRRKLLAAIAALRDPPPSTAPDAEPPPAASGDAGAGQGAERRHLTVLFCDLAGSTALSARLDPEDLREVMTAYHRAVAEAVRKTGGYVAKFLGDGVLAYFGWPEAHEDDAERAVGAGLAATEAVAGLETSAGPLSARVGIATGPVVVGDTVGTGEARERGVAGETPNVAARLQGLAEPGAVVLDGATRRLTGALFDFADLGEVKLRGLPRPVRAWRAVHEGRIESRFEALRSGAAPPPLVGREEELELLLGLWRRVRAGDGQVVLLGGEAGIGKSRLVAALREALGRDGHERLDWFCAPQHRGSALRPVITRLERAAAFAPADAPEAKLAKLRALLAPGDPTQEEVGLVADLLGLRAEGHGPGADLDARQRRERTLAALLRRVEALAARRPVLGVFEDAHWADPTTIELLDLIVGRAAGLPLLLVVTHRPEFRAHWAGQAQVAELRLDRLGPRDSAALVGRVAAAAGAGALPPEVVEEIVERTDGVPLFAEELTRTVLEAGYGAAGARAPPTVPATLHASLDARLERHAEAMPALEAIGRQRIAGKPHLTRRAIHAARLLFRAAYLCPQALMQPPPPPDRSQLLTCVRIQRAARRPLPGIFCGGGAIDATFGFAEEARRRDAMRPRDDGVRPG